MHVSTPNLNLSEFLCYFQRELSKAINRNTKRINHVFGGRYKWSLITSGEYFYHVYRYIYQNPLRANIVTSAEDYSYSTVQNKLLISDEIKVTPHYFESTVLPTDTKNYLTYINEDISNENTELIRVGLKRKEFKPPKARSGAISRLMI